MSEWTTAQVAEHTGMKAASVPAWARRHGVVPLRFARSGTGRLTAVYDAEQVTAVRASQPGRGNRTPRKDTP